MSTHKTVPTIGRIVHYKVHDAGAKAINKRRDDANKSNVIASNGGSVVHVGNPVVEGYVYPAMIVRVWGGTAESAVQLQVFLDGNDVFWATSVSHGDGPGRYLWPPRA